MLDHLRVLELDEPRERAVDVVQVEQLERLRRVACRVLVPVSGLGRRSAAAAGPLEGWRVASKGLAALPRISRDGLGRGYGSKGSGALPLPRAAAVSTGLRTRRT